LGDPVTGKYEAKKRIRQHIANGNDVFTATDVGISGVTLAALYQTGVLARVTVVRRGAWVYRLK